MAHFLTTNWTEKIKTNPVANMILNSNRPTAYHILLRTLTHHPPKGRYLTDDYFKKYLLDDDARYDVVDEEQFAKIKKAYADREQFKKSYNSAVLAQNLEKMQQDGIDAGIVGGDGDVAVVPNAAANDEEEDLFGDDEQEEKDVEYEALIESGDFGEDDVAPEILDVMQEEPVGGDMWANVFVDDYIHIHHPKLRYDYITAMTGKPLQIKPPSVFFSDV